MLTNSRSFSAQKTTQVHTEIAENAAEAGKETDAKFLMISRGDSTLRGHYPLETQILKNTLESKLGLQFDGDVLCPFFKEGGPLHGKWCALCDREGYTYSGRND